VGGATRPVLASVGFSGGGVPGLLGGLVGVRSLFLPGLALWALFAPSFSLQVFLWCEAFVVGWMLLVVVVFSFLSFPFGCLFLWFGSLTPVVGLEFPPSDIGVPCSFLILFIYIYIYI